MKKASDLVERYHMIVDITASLGIPFEEAIDMPDYAIYSLFVELQESRIPNHLGLKR
jgi:hypothetical protein